MSNEENQTLKFVSPLDNQTVPDIFIRDPISSDIHNYTTGKRTHQKASKHGTSTISRQRASKRVCFVLPSLKQSRVSMTPITSQKKSVERSQGTPSWKGKVYDRVSIETDKSNPKDRYPKGTKSLTRDSSNKKHLNKSWEDNCSTGDESSCLWTQHTLSPNLEEPLSRRTPIGGCLNAKSAFQTAMLDLSDISVFDGVESEFHDSLAPFRHNFMRAETTDATQLFVDPTLDQASSLATSTSETTIGEAEMEGQIALQELGALKNRLRSVDHQLESPSKKNDIDCADLESNKMITFAEIVEASDQTGSLLTSPSRDTLGNVFNTMDSLSSKYGDCNNVLSLERYFNPGMYALELLRDSISGKLNYNCDECNALVQCSTDCAGAILPKGKKGNIDIKTRVSVPGDDFVLNFILKAVNAMEKREMKMRLRTGTESTHFSSGIGKGSIDLEELQQLMPYTLSHLRKTLLASSLPITTATNVDVGLYQSENPDRNSPGCTTGFGLKKSQKKIWSEQETIVRRILQIQPDISHEMQEEFSRIRRQIDHLTSVQQEHLRRLTREQQAETRRRLFVPRTKPDAAAFHENPYSKDSNQKGLDKIIEPCELGKQLQRAAQDMNQPIPPLVSISTANSATVSLGPSSPQNFQWYTLLEREAQFYEKELYQIKDEYNRLLADEKQRHRDDRKAFLSALKDQYTTLSRQYKQTVDSLQRDARLRQKEQQALLERKLLSEQETARRVISLEQQPCYEVAINKMNQDTLDAKQPYTIATQPKQRQTASLMHFPKRTVVKKNVPKRRISSSDVKWEASAGLIEPGEANVTEPAVQEEVIGIKKTFTVEKGSDDATRPTLRRRPLQKGTPFVVRLPDEEEMFKQRKDAIQKRNVGRRRISSKLVVPHGKQRRSPLHSTSLLSYQNSIPAPMRSHLAHASFCPDRLMRDSVLQTNPVPDETDSQPKKVFLIQKTLPIPSWESLEDDEVSLKAKEEEEAVNWADKRGEGEPQRFTKTTGTESQQRIQNSRESDIATTAVTAGRSSVGRVFVLFTIKDSCDNRTTWLPGKPPSQYETGVHTPEAEGGLAQRPLPLFSGCVPVMRKQRYLGDSKTEEMEEFLVKDYGTGSCADIQPGASAAMASGNDALDFSAEPSEPIRCDYYYFGEPAMNDYPRYWTLINSAKCEVQSICGYHSYRQKPESMRSPLQMALVERKDSVVPTVSTRGGPEPPLFQITVKQGKDMSLAKEWERSEDEFCDVIGGQESFKKSKVASFGSLKVTSAMAAEAATLLLMRQRLYRIRQLFLSQPLDEYAFSHTLSSCLLPHGGIVTQEYQGLRNVLTQEVSGPLYGNRDEQAQQFREDIMHETIHSVLGKRAEGSLFREVLQGLELDLFSSYLRHTVAQRNKHFPLETEPLNPTPREEVDEVVFVELLQNVLEDALLNQLVVNTQGQRFLENNDRVTGKERKVDTTKRSEQVMFDSLHDALVSIDHSDHHKDTQDSHEVVCMPEIPCPLWPNDTPFESPKKEIRQEHASGLLGSSTALGVLPVSPSVLLTVKTILHKAGEGSLMNDTHEGMKVGPDTNGTQQLPITNTHTVDVVLELSKVEQCHSLLHPSYETEKIWTLPQEAGRKDIMQQEQPRCWVPEEDLSDVIVESITVLPAVKSEDHLVRNVIYDAAHPIGDSKVLSEKSFSLRKDTSPRDTDHYKDETDWHVGDLSPGRSVALDPVSISTAIDIPIPAVTIIPETVEAARPAEPEVFPRTVPCPMENRIHELLMIESERREFICNQEEMQHDILVMMQEWYSRLQETSRRLIPTVPVSAQPQLQQEEHLQPSLPPCPLDIAPVPSTVIRDPVIKFIFEWLKSFSEKRMPRTEGKDFVQQLHTAVDTVERGVLIQREPGCVGSLSLHGKESDTSLYESTSSLSSASSWLTSTNPSSYDPAGAHRFLQSNQRIVRVQKTLMPRKGDVNKNVCLHSRRCRPVLDASSSGSSNQRNTYGGSIDSLSTATGATTRYTTTTTTPGTTATIFSFSTSSDAEVRPRDSELIPCSHSDRLAAARGDTQASSESPPPQRPHFPWWFSSS